MREELEHYGIKRRSGRYPWGSGKDPYQRSQDFYALVDQLRASGMSMSDIAKSFSYTDPETGKTIKFRTSDLTRTRAIAQNEIRSAERSYAMTLQAKGMRISAIAERMRKNESSIRSLLSDSIAEKQAVLNNTAEALRAQVDEKGYIDISKGVEHSLGVTRDKLETAVHMLRDEGYQHYWVNQPQVTNPNQKTTIKVLGKPDTTYPELMADTSQIKELGIFSDDKGMTYEAPKQPRSVSSEGLEIVYGSAGGLDKDGLVELRRGVPELDMGTSKYAQVRILVDGTHYIKGMAVVSDDLPDGVNIRFNSAKENTGNKLDALKPIEPGDPMNPFGSQIRKQKIFTDENGVKQVTALNLVNDEGDWSDWSKTLSSQFLSKQPPSLAERQLSLFRDQRQFEFDEIMALTNESLKKDQLRQFSDKVDSDAADLDAMGLPGTAQHVIIPVPSIKQTEIFAPSYPQGSRVALVRHPHGGIFEIPELIVNNNNPQARRMLGANPTDAVAINAKTAEQLSGADFDGDTVLVIPNNDGMVKASRPLKDLRDFNPREQYKYYEGMRTMKKSEIQSEMGKISNLITDMQILGAEQGEVAAAIRHSMVVIDAHKHKLDYKLSFEDNNIQSLRDKYLVNGATTIVSRARADVRIPERKLRPAAEGGGIDPETGKLHYVNKPGFEVTTTNRRTGETVTETRYKTQTIKGIHTVEDSRDLMSSKTGTQMERVYADHANGLKAMANQARKEMVSIPTPRRDPQAAATFDKEVASLKSKLRVAQSNAPRERQAQVIADAKVRSRVESNPDLAKDPSKLKKVRVQELDAARRSVGARKEKINITPYEWEAIQSGALSHTPLLEILNNADPKQVKEYATPRDRQGITGPSLTRVRGMLANGYTQAEIAESIGVSVSTIREFLKEN